MREICVQVRPQVSVGPFCLVVLLEGRVPGLHFSVTVIVL